MPCVTSSPRRYLPGCAGHHHLGCVFAQSDLLDAQTGVIAVGIKAAHLRKKGQVCHAPTGQTTALSITFRAAPVSQGPPSPPRPGQTRGSGCAEQVSLVSLRQQLCPERGDTSPQCSWDGSHSHIPPKRQRVLGLQHGVCLLLCVPPPSPGDVTLRNGGHSSSPAWLRLSLCSQSVWKMLAVPSLYSGFRDTPEASQNRTVPSSCLGRGWRDRVGVMPLASAGLTRAACVLGGCRARRG